MFASHRHHDGSAVRMRFTPSRITINANHTLLWDARSTLRLEDVGIRVDRRTAVVSVKRGVEFTVMRYAASRDKPSFMGFYLNGEDELSRGADGLVGE